VQRQCENDFFYLLLVYFGLHAILAGNELLRAALFLLSGAWMGWMGFGALRQHFHIDQFFGCTSCASYRRAFQMGIAMNLLNPLTIVGWAAVAGNFFNTWSLQWPPIMPFGLFAITNTLIAVLTWQFLLVLLFHSIRKLVNATFLHSLSIFGGALLIVCGLGAWSDAFELIVTMLG
jgi:threonine/homoserine/homoserine lactone efflux protein